MQKQQHIISRKKSKSIILDIAFKQNNNSKPIVIFCHGYKGFKDWGCWNLLAEDLVKENMFFLKFNFSHNGGTIEEPIDFSDLNAFGENNFIKELNDVDSILNYITNKGNLFVSEIDFKNITLIGHSRGGGIVTLKAAEDSRVSKVITLAGVSDYKSRFPSGDVLAHWKKEGVVYIENGRTKQQMPHFIQFYNNFIENEKRLTISTAVKKIKIPHLILHGTTDETVTLKEAEIMHKWNPKSILKTIAGANHVFGSSHPWKEKTLPTDMQIAANHIKKFIN